MIAADNFKALGWRHSLWDLVRFYQSIHTSQRPKWLQDFKTRNQIDVPGSAAFPVSADDVKLFFEYLVQREKHFSEALALLRDEEESKDYCKKNSIVVGKTTTKNAEHHQSSKSVIAAVNAIAFRVCDDIGVKGNLNPQARCVWLTDKGLHVTARNMDGSVPTLANPAIIWEIKEYWGVTSGGSKMSDALYECNLVGRELREYQEKSGTDINHVVFVDGKVQWTARQADLKRFIDLLNQGLIDHLIVGKEIEKTWEPTLRQLIIDKVFKGVVPPKVAKPPEPEPKPKRRPKAK